jgi:membrane associated rhomboid family serine protease
MEADLGWVRKPFDPGLIAATVDFIAAMRQAESTFAWNALSSAPMTIPDEPSTRHQPAFNVPGVVLASIAVLLGIHFVRSVLLSGEADLTVLFTFAFIPARIADPAAFATAVPGGEGAAAWSFLTYALLHADWAHVGLNCLWLAAFGSPLAWRFGAARFLAFSAIGAVAGAATHLLANGGDSAPMIGASAAISAQVAGAARFVFTAGGPVYRFGDARAVYRQPAAPLSEVVRNSRVLIFIAAWLGANLLFGIPAISSGIASGAIAWQAHIGGFVAGLILFPLFDPVGSRPAAQAPPLD